MLKYLRLQCKRLGRYLPGALLAALILLGSALLAFQLFLGQNASREENQKFTLAICGRTDDPFLQMGISAMASFDSTRYAMEVAQMDEREAAEALTKGDVVAYAVIPEGFMEAAFAGEILPIRFCSTTGATGIASMVKEELSRVISDLLLSAQKGVYGMWDAMVENGLQNQAGEQTDRLSLVYVDHILVRDRIYTLQELGIADALGLESYLLCGLGVLLLLLICLPFAPRMIPGDPALGQMLCAKSKSAWKQALCDFLAYGAALLCVVLILFGAAKLILPQTIQMVMLWKLLPVLLFAAAFSFMLYSLSRDMIGGVMLQFFAGVALCFVSGCLYPVYFFPAKIQQLAQWLPTGIARTQLAGIMTGSKPAWTVPVLLAYCAAFLAIGVVARMQQIRGVKK